MTHLSLEQIAQAFQEAFPGHDLHHESIDFARAVERMAHQATDSVVCASKTALLVRAARLATIWLRPVELQRLAQGLERVRMGEAQDPDFPEPSVLFQASNLLRNLAVALDSAAGAQKPNGSESAVSAPSAPDKMRAEFWAWVREQGCDTDGAWSAWQGCWNLLTAAGAPPDVPAGWKLVPIEPTPNMVDYATMIAATPPTPVAPPDVMRMPDGVKEDQHG